MSVWSKSRRHFGTISGKSSTSSKMSAQESLLVTKEVESMLKMGTIQKTSLKKGKFLSNLFLVGKKDGGNRPVINLKNLNAFIPYLHFRMEGLHLLKDMLKEKDYMCKIDLKDAAFCVPLHWKRRKYNRFCWEAQFYESLCLCFGLGPAPRIFIKLLKIPIAILRRINILIIVSLDDMLLMCQTIEGLNMARTHDFLLQQLVIIINLKKSVLCATQKIEFLGLKIDSVNMTLTLPMETIKSLTQKCRNLMENPKPTL